MKKLKYKVILFFLIFAEFIILCSVYDFSLLYGPDSPQYLRLAYEIKNGIFFQKDFDINQGLLLSRKLMPFYSFCLAGLALFSQNLIFSAHLFSIFLTVFTFILLFMISRELESERTGLLILYFFILNPLNIRYGGQILTEPLFTMIFICAILLGIYLFRKVKIFLSISVGVVSGLAYITREIGIILLPVFLIFFSVYWRLILKLKMKVILLLLSGIFAGFILIAFPCWLHIRVHTGYWNLTARMNVEEMVSIQIARYYKIFDESAIPETKYIDQEYKPNQYQQLKSLYKIIGKKIIVLTKYLNVLFDRLGATISLGIAIYFYFLLAGLKKQNTKKIWIEVFIFMVLAGYILLLTIISPFMINKRYVYPILSLSMIFGGKGWLLLGEKIKKNLIYKNKSGIIVWFILIPLILGCYYLEFDSRYFKEIKRLSPNYLYKNYEGGVKEVVKELQEKKLIQTPGKIFLDRKPYYAYYFNGLLKFLPKTYSELKEYINSGKADYLVADSFTLKKSRPLLIYLIVGRIPLSEYQAYQVRKNDDDILVITHLGPYIEDVFPNVKVIYSRYLPKYRRIVTIYDLKAKKEPKEKLTLKEIKKRALKAFDQGYLYDAIKYAREGIKMEPQNSSFWELLVKSYMIYLKVVEETKSCFVINDFLVSELISCTKNWLIIDPENKLAKEFLEKLEEIHKEQEDFKLKVLKRHKIQFH